MSPEQYAKAALDQATKDGLAELSRPLTNTERSANLRRQRAAAGLREIRGVWAAPDDHPGIKARMAKMIKREAK